MLLADKLRTLGRYYGDSFTIELPTGSGNRCTLVDAADLIDNSLTALFRPVAVSSFTCVPLGDPRTSTSARPDDASTAGGVAGRKAA